jgi:hypothetical protein
MELESGLGGEELADQHTGVASGDKKEEGSVEGCAISPVAASEWVVELQIMLCSLEKADRSCGSEILGNSNMGMHSMGAFMSQDSCHNCGPAASCDPEVLP